MAIQITEEKIRTAKQTLRDLTLKIDVLNFNFSIVGEIIGNVISGTVRIDANSDIRRTCSIEVVVTDSTFDVGSDSKIWLDKYIKIQTGITDRKTNEIVWNNMGIFLINQPTYNYDAQTYTLSFEGVDLMAKMTGARNGYIGELAGEDITLIETGQNVREVIIGILQENNFDKYVVEECRLDNGVIQPVPYDMEFGQGSTWYDVLSELRNILPQYQIYFDVDGVFHYELIPSTDAEPVMIDTDIWQENVISEQVDIDFESVKNVIEVYGVTHDTQFFSDVDVSTVSEADIVLTVDQEFVQEEFSIVAFVLPSDAVGDITIDVNSNGAVALNNPDGTRVTSLAKDTYWVISYQSDDTWQFMGHLQAQGYWEDDNPESPFYVEGSIGRILLPLYGGEYENIQSDDLALQRAEYEIYRRCRLNDTIRLTTVPIYWADVNWKVSYISLNEKIAKEYMVQSVYTDLSVDGQQTWELSRFYPFYPTI